MSKRPQPKLFFLNGRLKWRGIPKDWQKPEDPTAYEELIKASDFVVLSDLQDCKLDQSPTVVADIQDLNQVLLEEYFRAGQNARHYQNDYFVQQWILILGTFITSLLATLTVAFGSTEPAIRAAGIITAVVTFVTTIVTWLVQSQRPQYFWYLWRTTTEELRRHYFLYLAHLEPYNTNECAEILEQNVAQIVTREASKTGTEAAKSLEIIARQPHSESDTEALIQLYRRKRVSIQLDFYKDRLEENKQNANFVAMGGVFLVGLATLFSAINAAVASQGVVVLISLLPVMAALLVLFEKVYGWGRQIVLYEAALKRLVNDNTIPPVRGHQPSLPYADILAKFVSSVENTLKSEVDQWGQSVLKDGSSSPPPTAQDALEFALAKSSLSKEQIENIRNIFNGHSG